MSIDSTWLRCPNCFLDLSPIDDRVFGCGSGHRFDRSKHGYLTLLPPGAPRTIGDDPEMLRARAELLGSGAYAPISDALVEAVRSVAKDAPGSPFPGGSGSSLRIADLGCGTGHYSAELARALPELQFLLADRSPDAVRASLRALGDATGIVLDIWRPLPLRTDSVDIILNVFAPRNLEEFARVIRPGGSILSVVPTERHLQELRRDGLVLDIPSGKSSRLIEQLGDAGLTLHSTAAVEYSLQSDAATRLRLAEMGPSAHHVETLALHAAGARVNIEPLDPVTVSVELLSITHVTPT
ncbi:methyltransferase domain-containing protein [Agromyces italicus]|uniref:methyltransferase domain-containing protein n=1 Tax=Agromyces italicus TaxID=279572 RepID=UPI0003B68E45|nr:methyltransferase domain-containing protein [Agromyces italicus]